MEERFVAADPDKLASLMVEEILLDMVPLTEGPGTRIGRYKLLQLIGEGGFGSVFMAEQETPVVRRVALKIIKLGMDTRQVIARFEAERQALAMMDHPNIAKVLDAGATDTGRPYFVMELVKGIPITRYCDERQLSLPERLALFGDVCSSINHAHQKGIIHRDIKPSNVMVTLHGDKPVVKVIDFGVAKATQGKLTDKTLFTRYEQFVGTPVYMSPEQASLSGLDIDTRSDIYALGILLYELLTGYPPFDSKSLAAAGYEEMRRIIREVEPPRPSMRLSTIAGEQRTEVARARQLRPEKLSRLVDADLDWIVMKAIDKDRSRRYETANGLAQDIQRFLSNEPVSATPPSAQYQLRKFVRRNKTALRLGAGIAAVLVAATAVSSWQAVRATRAEKKTADILKQVAAERDAKELARKDAEWMATFLTDVFRSPDPTRDGRSIRVVELLDNAARKLQTELTDQPEQRAKLQARLAGTYSALGLARQAIPLEEQVLEFRRKAFGLEHPETLSAMNNLANSYYDAGRRNEAMKMREDVLALRRKINGPDHPDTIGAMTNLAASYDDAGRLDEALKMGEKIVQLSRKINGPEHSDTLDAMHNLAFFYSEAGRREDALKLQEQVLTLRRKVNGPEHPDTLMAMNNLARSYAEIGRDDEAIRMQEEVVALRRKVLGPEHPETLSAIGQLATLYAKTGRPNEAIKILEQILTLERKINGAEHPDTLGAMNNLAILYAEAGRRDDALKIREDVLTIRRKVLGPEHPATLRSMISLAVSYGDARRWDEEMKLSEQVLALRRKVLGPEHPDTLQAQDHLSTVYLSRGALEAWLGQRDELAVTCDKALEMAKDTKTAEVAERAAKTCSMCKSDPQKRSAALVLARRAVELGQKSQNLPFFQMTLGMAEYRVGQYTEAAAALEAAEIGGKDRSVVRDTSAFFRAMCLFQQGKVAEARDLFAATEAKMKPFPADDKNPLAGNGVGHDDLIVWLACKEAQSLLNERDDVCERHLRPCIISIRPLAPQAVSKPVQFRC